MSSTFLKTFRKHWYAPEAVPIYVITLGACAGAAWYVYRLSQGPTVVWNHKEPAPYEKITPGTNTKFLTINQEFTRKYKRNADE